MSSVSDSSQHERPTTNDISMAPCPPSSVGGEANSIFEASVNQDALLRTRSSASQSFLEPTPRERVRSESEMTLEERQARAVEAKHKRMEARRSRGASTDVNATDIPSATELNPARPRVLTHDSVMIDLDSLLPAVAAPGNTIIDLKEVSDGTRAAILVAMRAEASAAASA